MNAKIVLLPGDGVGPEVVEQGRLALQTIAAHFGHQFEFEEFAIGGQAMDVFGEPLPDVTAQACAEADGILVGAVGGRRWQNHRSGAAPEQGLLRLKQGLGLFSEVRPLRLFAELLPATPLWRERFSGMDVLVVREASFNALESELHLVRERDEELERLFQLAFRLAQGRWGLVTAVHGEVPLSSVSKAAWYGPCRSWQGMAQKVAECFPAVKLEQQHVDFAAIRLVSRPTAFDVVVADATFGRMLLDEAALLGTSLALLPTAHLGLGARGLYAPVHGPCPELAGKGMANPIGAILGAALLLRHSLGLIDEANALENAVALVIAQGGRTVDMGGIPQFSTREMGEAICEKLEQDAGTDLARLLGHWG